VKQPLPRIPKLFCADFTVDLATPFRRYLNRLEVEIGREDYGQLKRVELIDEKIDDRDFATFEELTSRILATSRNHYNREQLRRLGVRVYLDAKHYAVYYRLAGTRPYSSSLPGGSKCCATSFGRRRLPTAAGRTSTIVCPASAVDIFRMGPVAYCCCGAAAAIAGRSRY